MKEVLSIPTPTAKEVEAIVNYELPSITPEAARQVGMTAFEALVLDTQTDTRVENKALVTTGTEYTMPEGDTNK